MRRRYQRPPHGRIRPSRRRPRTRCSSMSVDPAPIEEDEHDSTLAVHTLIAVLLGSLVTVVWWAAGRGDYWPRWVWLGLGISVALNVIYEIARRDRTGLP